LGEAGQLEQRMIRQVMPEQERLAVEMRPEDLLVDLEETFRPYCVTGCLHELASFVCVEFHFCIRRWVQRSSGGPEITSSPSAPTPKARLRIARRSFEIRLMRALSGAAQESIHRTPGRAQSWVLLSSRSMARGEKGAKSWSYAVWNANAPWPAEKAQRRAIGLPSKSIPSMSRRPSRFANVATSSKYRREVSEYASAVPAK